MLNNFQETVKIYKQGKEYYDGLRKIKNLVRDARKVQQTILMVGDITDIYVNSFERMLSDPYFTPEELSAIAIGYHRPLLHRYAAISQPGAILHQQEHRRFLPACQETERPGPCDGPLRLTE